jgi:uncharacterized Zn-finger protein
VTTSIFILAMVHQCEHCSKTFKLKISLMKHLKIHTLNGTDLRESEIAEKSNIIEMIEDENGKVAYQCKVCFAAFGTRKKILLHVPMHENSRNLVNSSKHQQLIGEDGQQCCHLCNKTFTNASDFKLHMSAHEENRTLDPTKVTRKTNTTSEIKLTLGTHNCSFCGKEFRRAHEKVKHERIHSNEKPYICSECSKAFRTHYSLSVHKKNVHSTERPYICIHPGCDKRFKTQNIYNNHIATHSTEKNFVCSICAKAFKTQVQLIGHKNVHTKPFACEICSRSFASLYAVKTHMASHEKEDSFKHSCAICGAKYSRSFAVRDHMATMHPDHMIYEDNIDFIVENEVVMKSENDGEILSIEMVDEVDSIIESSNE